MTSRWQYRRSPGNYDISNGLLDPDGHLGATTKMEKRQRAALIFNILMVAGWFSPQNHELLQFFWDLLKNASLCKTQVVVSTGCFPWLGTGIKLKWMTGAVLKYKDSGWFTSWFLVLQWEQRNSQPRGCSMWQGEHRNGKGGELQLSFHTLSLQTLQWGRINMHEIDVRLLI